MYNDKKKRFGDKAPYKPGYKRDEGRGNDWKPMFPATCATCGDRCEVPFKPNGRKPVLCSNCFKKEGPSDRPSFGGDRERPMRSAPTYSAPGDGNVAQQLKDINDKLDAIIEALNDE
ncbi:hypothetical protein K8R04_02185 [Candidatus Uhrbacteria bacterium]|nr:hypothetical protein [Candidatus Uhrbacteria bacterium]